MRTAIAKILGRANRRMTVVEVEEELQFHIEMLERKFTEQGMSPTNAKAAAAKRFGNLAKVKEQCIQITNRSSRLQRVLKASSILLAFIGLSIHVLSSDLKIAHIGDTLVMIAVSGRLLVYVRGLRPGLSHSGIRKAPSSNLTPDF
jgi:hypothetical protein